MSAVAALAQREAEWAESDAEVAEVAGNLASLTSMQAASPSAPAPPTGPGDDIINDAEDDEFYDMVAPPANQPPPLL